MKLMTNIEVIQSYLNQKNARNLSLKSKNGKLFSYDTCVSQYDYGKIIVNTTKYTKTTAHQVNTLIEELGRIPEQKIEFVEGIQRDTESLCSDVTGEWK